jgi:hypothetical protein
MFLLIVIDEHEYLVLPVKQYTVFIGRSLYTHSLTVVMCIGTSLYRGVFDAFKSDG